MNYYDASAPINLSDAFVVVQPNGRRTVKIIPGLEDQNYAFKERMNIENDQYRGQWITLEKLESKI